MTRWQLQDAKRPLSELVRRACEVGPQMITLRGRDAAVVISVGDCTRQTKRKEGLSAFLRRSRLVELFSKTRIREFDEGEAQLKKVLGGGGPQGVGACSTGTDHGFRPLSRINVHDR